MQHKILSRYLDPEVLSAVSSRSIEPRDLVMGNLAGAHKSPASGFAVEFAGHREYVPGDDPKHIDWRIYFNRDKFFIKQYEMETNFVCHLMLDVSASMRYGEGHQEKMLYASRMATTLGYSIVRQSDKVSLSTFDTHIRGHIPPSNSMHQVVRMTHHLDEVKPVEKTSMSQCINELAERMQRREIVMIFSDFFVDLDSIEEAIQRIRFNKHEVILFQIMHHDELYFDMDGMIKFVGLEVPDHILAQPEDLRKAYLASVNRFNTQLEELALRNKCDHILVDTSQDMSNLFADYLNKRAAQTRGR